MTGSLSFEAEWEHLGQGTPEERACFSALGIRYDNVWLTQADDAFVKRVRDKVHLSAYHLAEWLAWNWWRLRWEPSASSPDWAMAHRLATIGQGYVWPNITILSDGERVALLSKPTEKRPQEPLRYLADFAAVVRARDFEKTAERFIDQVRGQLRAENVLDTDLDGIWYDLSNERRDPEASTLRKFEALLGCDPDEAEGGLVQELLADSRRFGERDISEVAANGTGRGEILTATRLREIAASEGFDAAPGNVACLAAGTSLPPTGDVPAWKRGAEAARALRRQLHLEHAPLSNSRLEDLAGVGRGTLAKAAGSGRAGFSFALDESATGGKVVLRSKWETGRRFDLARLLGDRIAGESGGRLFPATRSYTYRQKMQRSFAAELLCPFEAVDAILQDDVSPEAIEDIAHQFNVSELAVRTLLVHHDRLEPEILDKDMDFAA